MSESLAASIGAEIDAAGGAIAFRRYMELALYAPRLGYYVGHQSRFGPGGDFVTAPELGGLFARCLARQVAELLHDTGGDVLEAGAGNGTLALGLLAELDRLGSLPARYSILELSPSLRQRQRALLEETLPHLLDRVVWLERPPPAIDGVVLANEMLDAVPADRFSIGERDPHGLYVGSRGGAFEWRQGELAPELSARVAELPADVRRTPGYMSELPLPAEAWVETIARTIGRGALVVIDYGYPRAEYYHPERVRGTLSCHYRHRVHDDPFLWPGLQDISVHVDFTGLADSARRGGLEVLGFASQAMFLLSCGLLDMAVDDPLAHSREIKLLTLPSEMGEIVKVLVAARGVVTAPMGFRMHNHLHRL